MLLRIFLLVLKFCSQSLNIVKSLEKTFEMCVTISEKHTLGSEKPKVKYTVSTLNEAHQMLNEQPIEID